VSKKKIIKIPITGLAKDQILKLKKNDIIRLEGIDEIYRVIKNFNSSKHKTIKTKIVNA